MSVLINGSTYKEFPLTKGVQQGDPFSPFLFVIAMEDLNVAMESAYQNSLVNIVNNPKNGPSISSLFYADDFMFVGKWTNSNFVNLTCILRCFHALSNLKVIFHKSKVYGIGVLDSNIVICARIIKCEVDSFPFKYLMVLFRANMSLKKY